MPTLPALGLGRARRACFDDLPIGTVVLLESPDRAAGFLPPDRLDMSFMLAQQISTEVRSASVVGYHSFGAHVNRITQVRAFLDQTGYGDVPRPRLDGDPRPASSSA